MSAAPSSPSGCAPQATQHLDGDMTIQSAADLRLLLLSALQSLGETPDATLQLDLSGVAALDSAGVQLLLAARRSLRERGQHLVLAAGNPTVNAVLRTLGLAELGERGDATDLPMPERHEEHAL